MRQALADYLDCNPSDLSKVSYDYYGLTIYEFDNEEYAVGTDRTVDEALTDYVKDTLWTFNADFLAKMTELPEEVFKALQPQCEGANEAILRLVEATGSLGDFVDNVVEADGRGHFLSPYDGEEIELDNDYYAYRIN